MDVLTRSYDAARTGANTQETILTPQKVGNNLLIRKRPILPAWIEDSASVSVHDDFNGHYLR